MPGCQRSTLNRVRWTESSGLVHCCVHQSLSVVVSVYVTTVPAVSRCPLLRGPHFYFVKLLFWSFSQTGRARTQRRVPVDGLFGRPHSRPVRLGLHLYSDSRPSFPKQRSSASPPSVRRPLGPVSRKGGRGRTDPSRFRRRRVPGRDGRVSTMVCRSTPLLTSAAASPCCKTFTFEFRYSFRERGVILSSVS